MTITQHFQVREFSKMAGVTVRTLQYYDRIGLLQPSDKTEAQHRLYERHDLIKLQHILTLKQLGFTLKEIKQMIHHPEYDVRGALKSQKQAIDAQIQQLQEVSSAMEHAMDVLDTTDHWDWETVQHIIQGVTDRQYMQWIQTYFTGDQLQQLTTQSQHISPEELKQAQDKWLSIAATLRENQHLPPDHPTLQALAQESHDLIQSFTQGNPEIEGALAKMYNNPENIPPAYQVFDDDLLPLYRQVMEIYNSAYGE